MGKLQLRKDKKEGNLRKVKIKFSLIKQYFIENTHRCQTADKESQQHTRTHTHLQIRSRLRVSNSMNGKNK